MIIIITCVIIITLTFIMDITWMTKVKLTNNLSIMMHASWLRTEVLNKKNN